jgi:hypothetical protein
MSLEEKKQGEVKSGQKPILREMQQNIALKQPNSIISSSHHPAKHFKERRT